MIACNAVRPGMTDTERDLWQLIEVTKAIQEVKRALITRRF